MQGDGDEVKAATSSAVRIAHRRGDDSFSDEAQLLRAHNRLGATTYVELRVDVAHMHLDRLRLHAEMSGDACVGFAVRQVIKHLTLAPRQRDDLLSLMRCIK